MHRQARANLGRGANLGGQGKLRDVANSDRGAGNNPWVNAGVVNGFGGNIGFWFLILRQPHPFPLFLTTWDGGGEYDDEISYWGSAIGATEIADIADILRRWKPAGTSCRFVLIDEDGTTAWGPGGLTGNYQTIPINEAWEYLPPSGVVTPYYNTDFLTP